MSWTVFISGSGTGVVAESRIFCISSPCSPFFSRKETFSSLGASLIVPCDSHRFAFSSRLPPSSSDCAISVGELLSGDAPDCACMYALCQSGMLLLDVSAMIFGGTGTLLALPRFVDQSCSSSCSLLFGAFVFLTRRRLTMWSKRLHPIFLASPISLKMLDSLQSQV